MESMRTPTTSPETLIEIKFADKSTVPLLRRPAYTRSISVLHDELHNFRITLKCCALDHSSCINRYISYLVFVILTIVVPIVTSFFVHVPSAAPANDPISLNKLVQLPESSLAAIAFVTLTSFFRHYGLRHMLFLDELQDDSPYVRREYTRELDKAFKHLAYILLPSFLFEITHKIIFFSTVTVPMPQIIKGVAPNIIMFIAVLASWIYRTGVFLLVCVFFKLTSQLQILRFEGFQKLFEGCESGSDTNLMFKEHMRIRKQLSITSHMYRWFIIMCLLSITASQFGALFMVLATKYEKSFFNSGDLVELQESPIELKRLFPSLQNGICRSQVRRSRTPHSTHHLPKSQRQWLMATGALTAIPIALSEILYRRHPHTTLDLLWLNIYNTTMAGLRCSDLRLIEDCFIHSSHLSSL